MIKGIYTILFLILSNVFMTFAWYGHLQFKKHGLMLNASMFVIILISWGMAFFEYCFQVPANRIGYDGNDGPFSMIELKTIQEAVSLLVFSVITIFIFKTDKFAWNHFVGFIFMILAVFFVFKKW